MGDREITEVDVPLNTELDRKIAEVFDVFDHSNSRRVDPREVGTIMRALGCCPTEAEVQELIVKMEDPQSPGSIFLGSFLPVMVEAITEHRFEPATADQLLEAFHVLDKEKVGFLPKEEMVNLITQDGEPFNQDELEEMMEIALDPQTQTIPYEYYINQLMYELPADNVYATADKIEAEKIPIIAPARKLSSLLKNVGGDELKNAPPSDPSQVSDNATL